MGHYFSHDEALPEIARVIQTLCSLKSEFVTHDKIVSGFLNDQLGQSLIRRAREGQRLDKPDGFWDEQKWSSMMIQWFSKRFTDGDSGFEKVFERKEINGAWAYKLLQ